MPVPRSTLRACTTGSLWQTHTLTMMIEALFARGQAARPLPSSNVRSRPANLQPVTRARCCSKRADACASNSAIPKLPSMTCSRPGERLDAWGLHNPSVAAWRSNAASGLAALGQHDRAARARRG